MNIFLEGRFHAHITVRKDADHVLIPPKGWKVTIIVLSNGGRSQEDVMITRHFVTGHAGIDGVGSIQDQLVLASKGLQAYGHEVLRVKLEHESLPTMPPSAGNYREGHIKIRVPNGISLERECVPSYVPSRNPMHQDDTHRVLFLNARYYEGTVEEVDAHIDAAVSLIQEHNPDCQVLEVKKETTVLDTNLNLDKWWA